MICGPPNQGSCWPCGGQAHEPIAFPSFCNEMQQSFNNLRLASLCHSPQVHFQMFSTRLYCMMHYNSECSSLRLKHKTICSISSLALGSLTLKSIHKKYFLSTSLTSLISLRRAAWGMVLFPASAALVSRMSFCRFSRKDFHLIQA